MSQLNSKNIEYICFEGSDNKGYAYIGFIKELESQSLLKRLNGAIGTSIGAFFAVFIVLGYSVDEIKYFLYKIHTNIYKNKWRKSTRNALNMLKSELKHNIAKKYNPDITLSELYNKTLKELIIVSYYLSDKTPVYFHYSNFPNIKLIDALISSITIPFGLKLRKYNFSYDYQAIYTNEYPLWIFNEINALYEGNFTKPNKGTKNSSTIGIKLLPTNNKHTYYVYKKTKLFNTTISKHIIDTLLLDNDTYNNINKQLNQPISIPRCDILFFDFYNEKT